MDEPLPIEPAGPVSSPHLSLVASTPFRISGTVELVDQTVPPPDPCLALFASVIRGTATDLGRFEGVGSTCIETQTPAADPPFLPAGPAPYVTAIFDNPSWVLTAANGDELWLEATDAVAVISLADNSLRARGVHTILGGTGRFAGAVGEIQSEAVNEDGQGPDDFQSSGWIRYDASNRPGR